jgi:hypothetical protein
MGHRESKPEAQCPECGRHLHRVERKGFFEIKILPLFGYYPWVCGVCRSHIYVRMRYRARLVRKESAG